MSRFPNTARLAAVDPADVATYLRASGWYEADEYNRAVIWAHGRGDQAVDVLAPYSRDLRDYSRRMFELLTTVAEVEQREPNEVLSEILSLRVDVQYIRTMPEAPSGTTPLHHGYQAVKGVHDLFLAAATSAHLPESLAVLPSRKPREAWDFLGGVRLGQTTPGSYVYRIETPLVSGDDDDGPSSRKVLEHLHQAVSSAHAAASMSGLQKASPFQHQIASGVSANLCEALSDIGALGQIEFELKFDWAKALRSDVATPDLTFNTELIDILKKAGQYLRNLPTHLDAQVEGKVVELRSHRPDRQGVVVVEGVLETPQGKSIERVVVALSHSDYELALRAHPESKRVRVIGQAKTSGRQPELSSVTEFTLLHD